MSIHIVLVVLELLLTANARHSYGLGAAVVPLAATAFASAGILFARFYSISCGLACVNTALLLYGFRFNYVVDVSEPEIEVAEAPGIPPVATQLREAGNEEFELAERPQPATPAEKWDQTELEAGRPSVSEFDTRFETPSRVAASKKRNSIMLDALKTRATVFVSAFILL